MIGVDTLGLAVRSSKLFGTSSWLQEGIAMKNRTVIIIAAIGGALLVCCVALAVVSMITSGTPEFKATSTARAAARLTQAAVPTNTPKPTAPPTEPPPTSTPTPQPIGMSRDNPAPLGQVVTSDAGDDFELVIMSVDRGQAAQGKLNKYNVFNPDPDAGMEFVLVLVSGKYLGAPDKTRTLSSSDFRLVGDKGAIYTQSFAVLSKDFKEVFGGGTTEGELLYQLAQGEGKLVLIYDSGMATTARYLSLGQ
jgi:hypothetical protein